MQLQLNLSFSAKEYFYLRTQRRVCYIGKGNRCIFEFKIVSLVHILVVYMYVRHVKFMFVVRVVSS